MKMTQLAREVERDCAPAWQALLEHQAASKDSKLAELFANDAQRGDRFTVLAGDVYLDYSKNRINAQTVNLLLDLATQCHLTQHIDALFSGAKINFSEARTASHIALRASSADVLNVNGVNVVPMVHEVLEQMAIFSDRIRSGSWLGASGKVIRNVINVGIGGSDLGPKMAYEALKYYSQRDITVRFIANVDESEFEEATRDLNPEETLFIVCSKSFTTFETLTNAYLARAWLLSALNNDVASVLKSHFVAVSSNVAAVEKFGISMSNLFVIWDWVGARYSMCSAVGLSTMIAIGPVNFRAMLDGFRLIDMHVKTTPMNRNLPVILGLIAVWNANFLDSKTVAVLPYEHYLAHFPAYLQQLTMESNGKHVNQAGESITVSSSPVYWGEPGTNCQHSFSQLLHQGTQIVPCDFIGFAQALFPKGHGHDILLANLFAQARALAFGKSKEQLIAQGCSPALAPQKVCEGNRPSNTLLVDQLTPSSLGQLIAVYEHSVFVQGVIWKIDSFDQWGVELGKELAPPILADLIAKGKPKLDLDSSTNGLIHRMRRLLGRAMYDN